MPHWQGALATDLFWLSRHSGLEFHGQPEDCLHAARGLAAAAEQAAQPLGAMKLHSQLPTSGWASWSCSSQNTVLLLLAEHGARASLACGEAAQRAQKEARALSAECVTLRAQGQEGAEASEAVRRENGHLAEEIRDLLEQVGSGGRSVHELERVARRLEVEREEVQVALEEAERALEQCEAKCSLSQLECSNVR